MSYSEGVEKSESVILRACDFFDFNGKVALIRKELRALERPENQKSHTLSG
jgi:hypothetical protein